MRLFSGNCGLPSWLAAGGSYAGLGGSPHVSLLQWSGSQRAGGGEHHRHCLGESPSGLQACYENLLLSGFDINLPAWRIYRYDNIFISNTFTVK